MLRSCISTISKFKPNEFIHESLTEFNNSDVTDSYDESDDSDAQNGSVSDQKSVISDLPIPPKKSKSKTQNPVCVAPAYSIAFIDNVHPDITKQNIREWICDEHNNEVNLSDIEKLTTVGKSNAFKISAPKDKLEQTSTGWPNGIKAEPYLLRGYHGFIYEILK